MVDFVSKSQSLSLFSVTPNREAEGHPLAAGLFPFSFMPTWANNSRRFSMSNVERNMFGPEFLGFPYSIYFFLFFGWLMFCLTVFCFFLFLLFLSATFLFFLKLSFPSPQSNLSFWVYLILIRAYFIHYHSCLPSIFSLFFIFIYVGDRSLRPVRNGGQNLAKKWSFL